MVSTFFVLPPCVKFLLSSLTSYDVLTFSSTYLRGDAIRKEWPVVYELKMCSGSSCERMYRKIFFAEFQTMNIDLGSVTTRIGQGEYVKSFATALAVDEKTGRIVAHGDEAAVQRDRTPRGVRLVRPVRQGSVTDIDLACKFLRLIWSDVDRPGRRGPTRVLTQGQPNRLEMNVLAEAVSIAGGTPEFIPNALACAAGQGIDIDSPNGLAILNFGAETTEVSVYAKSRLLRSELLNLGTDELTQSIKDGASNEFGADVSWWTAEQLKRTLGNLNPDHQSQAVESVVARDRLSGLPVEFKICTHNVRVWFKPFTNRLRGFLRQALANLPPRIAGDVFRTGLYLSGGGAKQNGIEELVHEATGVRATTLARPISGGVIGASLL